MHKTKIGSVIIAWMLLITFITPVVVKHIHIAEYAYCSHTCSHADEDKNTLEHDCVNCPICHFVFSLFLDIVSYKAPTILNTFACRPAVSYQSLETLFTFGVHYKRGPPHALSL